MVKNQTFLLFILSYIFIFINSANPSEKHKAHHVKQDNKFKKNIRKKFSKRKIQDDGGEDEAFPFVPLSIYIDKEEFKDSIPDELRGYEDKYSRAMDKAKEILEDFLEIQTDTITAYGKQINVNNYVFDNYGITKYTDIFRAEYLSVKVYNFYILSKFTDEIGEESSSVIIDDFSGVPLVGIILFNKNIENLDKTKLTEDYLTTLMLHHFIRLLGFNAALSDNAYGNILPHETDNDGNDIYYLKTEGEYDFTNVINYAKKYFNCPRIERIDLYVDKENLDENGFYYDYCENDIIGLYWPKRLFLGELLTKFDYPEEQVLSGFTLAFLDDLPYLRVTKNYMGGSLKFGKNKGCEFFFNNCGDSSNPKFTFANEFFLPNDQDIIEKPSCSSGRLSKTIYKLQPIEADVETAENTEYFFNHKAGPKSTNYCPIAQYDNTITNRYIYTGRCSEIDKTDKNDDRNEELGKNSFCVLSSLEKNDPSSNTNTEPEVLALCYEMHCSPKSLTIRIGNNYIVCPREGGKIKAENFKGFLLCPDYNLICTNKPLCNNLFDCLKSNEKEDSFNYDDYKEIKTTQNFTIYNSAPIDYGWELTNDGICPHLCTQCSATNCIQCAPNYNLKDNTCIYAIEHCKEIKEEENNICTKCDDNYFLVQNFDGSRYCESGNINKFYIYDNDLRIYKKCESDITNCDECTAQNHCTKCKTNFGIVDNDHTSCVNLLDEKYYYDTNLETFKLCSNKISNCELCSTYDDIICKKCLTNFAVKHDNNIICEEISTLNINKNYYTNDSQINYYSCHLYHDALNCDECSNKEICDKCQEGYNPYNDNKLCARQSDIDNNIFIWTGGNILAPCSSLIENCHQCSDITSCSSCKENAFLTNVDTCISKASIEENKNYYKDETTQRYISCSVIANCITCDSGTVCTSCQNGFRLDNNKCVSNNNEDDDNNLSTGAIIGIVFGSLGFLLIVGGIIYYLLNKVYKKGKNPINNIGENDKIEINEEKIEKVQKNEEIPQENQNQIDSYSIKRNIHNS